mmetsp:Transcript_43883/g.71349  ORF Transcript_43883/g.71349 Transcript_43883/m.71349 type:complete len:140 (-) Transcript_43883:165-584(-)
MHASEAAHGDLGHIRGEDVLLAISYSGETPEILHIIPGVQKVGSRIVAFTGNPKSRLSQHADVTVDICTKDDLSDPHWDMFLSRSSASRIAPWQSTIVTLSLGHALAIALAERSQFSKQQFLDSHPGGVLGKRNLHDKH